MGKCLFCGECALACPGRIEFTKDYKLASNRREALIVREGEGKNIGVYSEAIRPEVRGLFRRSLKMRQVSAGGDGSCEMELNATGNVNFDVGRHGVEFAASPRHADAIVLTGPISAAMAGPLREAWEATPDPKILIVVGADAISGGLFAQSPAIDRTFLDEVQPDLYVPGNPAHPLTFINGVLQFMRGGAKP